MNNTNKIILIVIAALLTGCAVTSTVQPSWYIKGEVSDAYINSMNYCLNQTHIIVGKVDSAYAKDRFHAAMNSCMGSRGWARSNGSPTAVKPLNEPVEYKTLDSRRLSNPK